MMAATRRAAAEKQILSPHQRSMLHRLRSSLASKNALDVGRLQTVPPRTGLRIKRAVGPSKEV